MKRKMSLAIPGILLILSGAASTLTQTESQSQKTPYRPNGGEGSLSGTVSLSGTPPQPMKIDMSADPVCYETNRNPSTEYFVVSNGRLANVLVYVKSGTALEGLSFETPTTNVVLDQHGCRYAPHVLGIQVNQTLEVRNGDNTTQNIHPVSKLNREWNQSQAPLSAPLMKQFPLPEIAIPFKDNQHPWKKAWVGVFEHPFFAVSDSKGAFTIAGLPPGKYSITAWHEQFGEKTFEVVIYPGHQQTLEVGFDMTERKLVR